MTWHKLRFALVAGLLFGIHVDANPIASPVIDLIPRQTIIPGGKPCGQNNATNRGCWKNNWNISTDYEETYPPAFNTRVVRAPAVLLCQSLPFSDNATVRLLHHQCHVLDRSRRRNQACHANKQWVYRHQTRELKLTSVPK